MPLENGSRRRPPGPATLAAALLVAASLLAGCGGGAGGPATVPRATAVDRAVASAVSICDPGDGGPLYRSLVCMQRRLLAIVSDGGATASELPLIDAAARREGGFLLDNCHVMMHWVGRNYALERGVSLGTLQGYLPRTNDPGCSAGFAHGLISALGPTVSRLRPAAVARVCAASPTRYQAYSCVHGLGHAYMRAYNEALPLALRMCARLPQADAADCAQGAFHDYWFSVRRVDGTSQPGPAMTPRSLCRAQPAAFVRACWYRAFMEVPPRRQLARASDAVAVCDDLRALQREACVTGASAVVGSGDPYRQLDGCSRLAGADGPACVRGVAAQDLLGSPLRAKVRLIERCDGFRAGRAGCVRWVAKALNVVADGRFLRLGCPLLASADRAACRLGASSWRGPLETFG